MRILLFCALSLAVFPTWAQTGKITKVKGNRAIVDFGGHSVREGQTVQIGGSRTPTATSEGLQARQHGLNYSFLYQTQKPSSGPESKSTGIEVDYGYNLGQIEFGPLIGITNEEFGSSKTNITTFGGFAQYNFVENAFGNDLIPYAKIALLIFNENESKTSATILRGGGGILYFPFSQIFALNASLAIGSVESKTSSASSTSSLLTLQAGWRIYF